MINFIRLTIFASIFILFACGNSQQNMTATNVIAKTDSLNMVDSNKVENTLQRSSGKSMDELLKSGQKGIFQDSFLTAIIGIDYAYGIKSNVFKDENDRDSHKYTLTSYLKDMNDWKVNNEKTFDADLPFDNEVKLEDIDEDGQKDIMCLLYADGRGNQKYNLFLVKGKNLIELKGFEDLSGPIYDKKKKMIVSTSSYHGGSVTEYYKLVKDTFLFIEGIEHGSDKGKDFTRKYTKKED